MEPVVVAFAFEAGSGTVAALPTLGRGLTVDAGVPSPMKRCRTLFHPFETPSVTSLDEGRVGISGMSGKRQSFVASFSEGIERWALRPRAATLSESMAVACRPPAGAFAGAIDRLQRGDLDGRRRTWLGGQLPFQAQCSCRPLSRAVVDAGQSVKQRHRAKRVSL
jgi:hypothetical protein